MPEQKLIVLLDWAFLPLAFFCTALFLLDFFFIICLVVLIFLHFIRTRCFQTNLPPLNKSENQAPAPVPTAANHQLRLGLPYRAPVLPLGVDASVALLAGSHFRGDRLWLAQPVDGSAAAPEAGSLFQHPPAEVLW